MPRKKNRKRTPSTTRWRPPRRRVLSWQPVRSGDLYCAPACGRGCTRAEYLQAQRLGNKLARRMGKEWRCHVHENLGWHYTVISSCGRLKLIEHAECVTAFLGAPALTASGRYSYVARTPEAAVAGVLAVARSAMAEIQALVTGFPERK